VGAKGREHAMLFGKMFKAKSRDKKYPVSETSKLYVKSRTCSVFKVKKGPEMAIACLGSTVLAVTGPTRQLGICHHRHLSVAQFATNHRILYIFE